MAEFELASVLIALGDIARAISAMRTASEVVPRDPESEKDRLTYLMNLGEMLEQVGEYDEAYVVLERGLTEREKFYGADHPGVAYGLEPLAVVELARGQLDSARNKAERALSILWNTGHPRVTAALALRAEILVAMGSGEDLFESARTLPDEMFDEMVNHVLRRAEGTRSPRTFAILLSRLLPEVRSRSGSTSSVPAYVLAALTHAARDAGDHGLRVDAHKELIARFDGTGDPQAIDAVLGLALAESDAHHHDEASAAYEDALTRATKLGDEKKRAAVLRNYALHLAEGPEPSDAEPKFSAALAIARSLAEPDTLGRALIAQGIYEQHQGKLEPASQMLEEALGLLPPSHPDTLYARSHLNAIREHKSCGCGDMSGAISEALREMVLPLLPEGLLTHLAARVSDEKGIQLEVQLAREPTEAELDLLNQVLQQAVAELQQKIRRSGMSS